MLMTAMEREQKLEGGAVAIGVEVGVGDFAEVVPVARAGLLAPAAQAEAAQFAPCGGAEVGLLGAVEPFRLAGKTTYWRTHRPCPTTDESGPKQPSSLAPPTSPNYP